MRREQTSFDEDIREDHELIARTLAGSIEMVWRNRGAERALALVREANRLREHIRVRWVWLGPDPGDARPLIESARLRALRPRQYIHETERLSAVSSGLKSDPAGEPWLVSYHAVGTPSGRTGAIELAESLRRKRQSLESGLLTIGATTIALVLVCAALVLVAGIWFVGRPIEKLAIKARRVGHGDLTEPLALRQEDEIGELAHEMNAMCERLAAANARLKEETEARIAALEQLRHADRLKTVGQLAAGVAHELGTPLNIVLGRAKMIGRRKADSERVGEYANIIREQSERMARIIRQLLDYARPRQPKAALEDLSRLVSQTVELLKTIAEKKKVALVMDASAALLVEIDVVQLQQALTNVVVNAIDASQAGQTVAISTGRETRQSGRNGAGAKGAYAYVRVADRGEGMNEEMMQKIFDPFFTTKTIGEGTGLGLAVTQDIVKDHRGFITAESRIASGSTFTIYLPMMEVA